MSNPQRGDVTFEVPGAKQTYRLRMSWNAAAISEEPAGRTFYDALDDIAAGRLSVRVLRALFWSCLQEAHPGLTLNDAGDLIERVGHIEAWKLVRTAIERCFEPLAVQAESAPGDAVPPQPAASQ